MDNVEEGFGTVIFRREDGAIIVHDGINEDGFDLGHIVLPDGTILSTRPVVALLAHGTDWVGVEGT